MFPRVLVLTVMVPLNMDDVPARLGSNQLADPDGPDLPLMVYAQFNL